MKTKLFFACVLVLFIFYCDSMFAANVARPKLTAANNYLIGYGSLMQLQSRIRTVPLAVEAFPVAVTGFKRLFGMRGSHYKTTFLTVTGSSSSKMNAVYFKVNNGEIEALDKRESSYDRQEIPFNDLGFYIKNEPSAGDFWIYVKPNADCKQANNDYPLTQSYVDIFLEGCFQMQDKYHLTDFAQQCVDTTDDWPATDAWVNDRLHPRRPFDNPYAHKIDNLLAGTEKIKNYWLHRFE